MACTWVKPADLHTATLGPLHVPRMLVAQTPWQRLRGWYGYVPREQHANGLDAVLLTRTKSIHTLAMRFALDLLWLDAELYCLGYQLNVQPWRCCWHARAAHVIELPTLARREPGLELVGQQRLQIYSPRDWG